MRCMMEENLILDKLVQFGLTRQEANIYLCLYQNGELTGYEVAKMTGISRSNVYGGLSDLTDKGAAFLVQGSSNRYVAASIEEFCDHKVKDLQNARTYLCEHIPEVKKSSTGYITVEGYSNIRSKMSFMLEHTGQRVYIAAKAEYVNALEEELLSLVKRQIKIVLITDGELNSTELKEHAILYRSEGRGNVVHLITDSEYALTGEINKSKSDTCLYTAQANFIKVFKEMLRNEMKLIEINEEKG